MPDVIELPPMVVSVTKLPDDFNFQITRIPYNFVWNPNTGTFDIGGGTTSMQLTSDMDAIPEHPSPPAVVVDHIDVTVPFIIDGYIMQTYTYYFSDNSIYSMNMRVDASGNLYAVFSDNSQTRASFDGGASWVDYNDPVPRAAYRDGGSGGGGDHDQQ